MTIERIGDAVLYECDCLEVLPTLGPVDAVVTDPVWPNAHPDLQGSSDPEGLFRSAMAVLPGADRLLVWLGCQSDPRFMLSVPSAMPFLRMMYMRRAVPSYNGRCLVSGDVVYAFGTWPKSCPGRRVLPGECSVTSIPSLRTDHICSRNETHANWIVHWWSDAGDNVIDPFMGSGTTGVACANLGRKFIGIEIEPKYFDIACERIRRAYQQPRLFEDPKPAPEQALLVDEP